MRRRLLLVGLLALLSSCSLLQSTSPAAAPDPLGASLTHDVGPQYDTLIFLPGKALSRNTVAHLKGPALRVQDSRCVVEGKGLACKLGTVLPNERRVIYVSGLDSAYVDATREDGSTLHVAAR